MNHDRLNEFILSLDNHNHETYDPISPYFKIEQFDRTISQYRHKETRIAHRRAFSFKFKLF